MVIFCWSLRSWQRFVVDWEISRGAPPEYRVVTAAAIRKSQPRRSAPRSQQMNGRERPDTWTPQELGCQLLFGGHVIAEHLRLYLYYIVIRKRCKMSSKLQINAQSSTYDLQFRIIHWIWRVLIKVHVLFWVNAPAVLWLFVLSKFFPLLHWCTSFYLSHQTSDHFTGAVSNDGSNDRKTGWPTSSIRLWAAVKRGHVL